MARSLMRAVFALHCLFLLPVPVIAMEATCGACVDACCQWSHGAGLARADGRPSIEAHSREDFERYGFGPIPCTEFLEDERAYHRCAERAFDRCAKSHCCKFRLPTRSPSDDVIESGRLPGLTRLPRLGEILRLEEFVGIPKYEGLGEAWRRELEFDQEWSERLERGNSGSEPVEFRTGQVIVVKETREEIILEAGQVVAIKRTNGCWEVVLWD